MTEKEELIFRVFSDDKATQIPNALFLFGQTEDNEKAAFNTVCHLAKLNQNAVFLIMDSGPLSGYPGFENWSRKLTDLGISHFRIQGIPAVESTSLNSLIEAQSAIRYAKREGHESLGVIAAPFHHFRAFLTAATVAIREYPELVVRSYPGSPLSWDERVVHSQGVDEGSRVDLLEAEMQRISIYQEKGDMQSFESILTYVRNR